MANQLGMAEHQAIVVLAKLGRSYRQIATELGVHRDTVSRHVKPRGQLPSDSTSDSKQAISIAGAGESESTHPGPAKPAIPIAGSAGRRSKCEPYRETIISYLEQGLSAQAIWQALRAEHGFEGSYLSVQRFARRLRSTRPLPFRRMECAAGEEAQVDFGTGAPVISADGKRRRPHLFRIVLSHSRKAYSEVVYRQNTEEFVRCLENAFWHFGGVPKTLVVDNLKAAVIKADWYDPELNPKIQAFCEHYGTVMLPTRPRMPRHKGKVERSVQYAQSNALKGKSFASLEAQNRHLHEWEAGIADTRIHGTTRKQVGRVFEEVERPLLQPLPAERFPFFHEVERRSVNRDGHIVVDKAYYSVPPEYLGRKVWARWDSRVVRIFDRRLQQIAIHVKHEAGRFSTDTAHITSEKISGVERGAHWLLNKVGVIGPDTLRWAQAMVEARGIQGVRVLQGLLNLAGRHPQQAIERACRIADSHGAYRLRAVRQLIKREQPPQEQFEFTQEHAIIRSLSDYDRLIRSSFRKQGASP